VNRAEQRVAEAQKLGFERIFISKYNRKGIDPKKYRIEIVFVGSVADVVRKVF
jgi:DNA repair protein RadA/Sms